MAAKITRLTPASTKAVLAWRAVAPLVITSSSKTTLFPERGWRL